MRTLDGKLAGVLPPNVDAGTMRQWLVGTVTGAAVVGSLLFLGRYYRLYQALWHWEQGRRVLSDTALMADFPACAVGVLLEYALLAAVALATAAVLYGSYFQGSRSIDLMRRLPDGRRTLRRQVWTVPLCWAASLLVTGAVLLGGCCLLWRFVTPEQCLPTPENLARVRSNLDALHGVGAMWN